MASRDSADRKDRGAIHWCELRWLLRIAAEIEPAFATASRSFNPKPEATAFLAEFTSFGRNAHAFGLRLNEGLIYVPVLSFAILVSL